MCKGDTIRGQQHPVESAAFERGGVATPLTYVERFVHYDYDATFSSGAERPWYPGDELKMVALGHPNFPEDRRDASPHAQPARRCRRLVKPRSGRPHDGTSWSAAGPRSSRSCVKRARPVQWSAQTSSATGIPRHRKKPGRAPGSHWIVRPSSSVRSSPCSSTSRTAPRRSGRRFSTRVVASAPRLGRARGPTMSPRVPEEGRASCARLLPTSGLRRHDRGDVT